MSQPLPSPSPFLYWFERRQMPPQHLVNRFGKFRAMQPGRQWQDTGGKGCLATRHTPGASLDQVDWKAYRWTRVSLDDDQRATWVGARNDVMPEELRNHETDGRGVPVTLADGQSWRLPVLDIRSPDCCLPSQDFLIDGEWRPVPRQEYKPLSDRAMSLAGKFREAILRGANTFRWGDDEDEQIRELIVDALSIHYNLNVYEASALGLFSSEVYYDAVCAIIDWRATRELITALLAEQEGNGGTANPSEDTAGTSNTDCGAPAFSRLTSQPAPTPG